ncbi:hypothetical protein CTAYLR_009724 [Chrysophaeum taylorii]|uniref:Uncharacterized protein n=1 Tax=Chrysophaeum taylorii TaxID=2483200 RepID=A0AAD7XPU9_9STRA|nr:hypothetical protein CTAYLR_009724 [Chrysophaeum taylorii]
MGATQSKAELKRTAVALLFDINASLDCKEERLFFEPEFGVLDGVSDAALDALAHKRITEQSHLVEISRLFEKVGVEHHKVELLKLMVPGANGCPWSAQTSSEAAANGHLDLLKWARSKGCPWDANTCTNAALAGHLHVLKWARANACPFRKSACAETDDPEVQAWLSSQID